MGVFWGAHGFWVEAFGGWVGSAFRAKSSGTQGFEGRHLGILNLVQHSAVYGSVEFVVKW